MAVSICVKCTVGCQPVRGVHTPLSAVIFFTSFHPLFGSLCCFDLSQPYWFTIRLESGGQTPADNGGLYEITARLMGEREDIFTFHKVVFMHAQILLNAPHICVCVCVRASVCGVVCGI